MAPMKHLIIADGHHRYETALLYQQEMQARFPDAPRNAAFNHRLVNLVSMDDPGLAILPTHRLIRSHQNVSGAEVLEKANAYFDVTPMDSRQALEAALEKVASQSTHVPYFGFHDGTSAVLTLKDDRMMKHLLPERIPEWRALDVAVVHELFIERVLGIDKEMIAENGAVEFLRDSRMGYDAVDQNEAAFFLVMNPTRIEQVQACSTAGERMPQKSTDFYPKVISGLISLPVGASETL